MKKTVFTAATALLISGCNAGVSETELKQIKNVGVYSLFSDDMHHIYIGTTVFGNKKNTLNVAEWEIADYSEKRAKDLLKEGSAAKKAGIIKVNNEHIADASALKSSIQHVEPILEAAAEEGYDTAVIITPADYGNEPFLKPGYGIYTRSLLGKADTCAYALFTVDLYNTHSKKAIGGTWGFNSWNDAPCSREDISPDKSADDYGPKEMQRIRDIIKSKINKGLVYALGALRLKDSGAD